MEARDAHASRKAARASALERWNPDGPASAADLPQAIGVARAIIRTCSTDEVIDLTRRLVALQTVAAIAPAPSNPEFQAMAQVLTREAAKAGLQFRDIGPGDAWEITLAGRGDARALSLITHGDVVPVNDPPSVIGRGVIPEGWTVPAFDAKVVDGRLYGRGTEDDKVPIAASLVVMREMRAAGILPDGEVTLAIGTAEEEAWEGMRRYAAQAKHARYTVSLDAGFPVVSAQSGFVAWGVRAPAGKLPTAGKRPVIRELQGGLFLTQVPDHAWMVIEPRGESVAALLSRAQACAAQELEARGRLPNQDRFRISVQEQAGATASAGVRIVVDGVSAHASVAAQGRNALWPLASMARRLDAAAGGARAVLDVIADAFDGDQHGERLGVAYEDPFMGRLLVAATRLRLAEGYATVEVNMRRPRGPSSEAFTETLQGAVRKLQERHGKELEQIPKIYVGSPYVVDATQPLVTTLLGVYRDVTGREGKAEPMNGGTYARLFEGAVDFGPGFPGAPYTGHGADEYVEVAALSKITEMVFEAAIRLTTASRDSGTGTAP